jgi:hypothetical protein
MSTLANHDRLASASAVLFGHYGDVTRLAQQRDVCRQALYRQTDALLRQLDDHSHQESLQCLRLQLQQLQTRCDQLQRQLQQAVVFDADRLAEFAATAQAEGVSLPACRRLLQVPLRERAPSVARLGRWTKAAGQRSAALLEVCDEHSRPCVRQAAGDEIFVRQRPILMVVEPHSLCWVSGRLAPQRDGVEWAKELARLPALEQLAKDGGTGLAKGVALVNAQRRRHEQPLLAEQDDHFHVLREGRRALRQAAAQARRALEKADAQDKRERRRQRGPRAGKRSGHATAVARCWRQAEQVFDAWSRQERAWQQVAAAFTLFGPTGQLQTRTQAEAVVAAALLELLGQRWAKVRRLLVRPQLWTYLDQAQAQVAALPVAPELREAALRVEGIRRRPGAATEGPKAAAVRGVAVVAAVLLSLAGAAGTAALTGVRGALSGVWRASSLVEGINSVLRMQQARHRRVTQGLLDLKRLYWNCHQFRTGKRRKQSPYERLGLRLPLLPWWELLKLSPQELRQQLSAQQIAA